MPAGLSGVQVGIYCRPSRCCAALSDSESVWRGQAAVHRYPGPWFIWLQLQTWVNSWACSQHWRQASGPGKKALERQGKLGQSKTWAKLERQVWNFPRLKLVCSFDWQTSITMTEDHVSSLFCCYSVCLVTIKLNSISQSDQSSCESLYWKSFR